MLSVSPIHQSPRAFWNNITEALLRAKVYGQVADVRSFGVVGNGVADDTAALILAGIASKSVYIDPSLTCLVTGSLASGIQSGQRWFGGGKIITANGFDHHVFDIAAKTDVVIENIVGVSGTLGAAYGAATARFFRCTSAAHRCKMLYCFVTGFQSAAQVNASEHCQMIGNDIVDPSGWGINVQTDAHDAIVAFNRISGVANEHGIYAAGTNSDNTRAPHIFANIVTDCAIDGIKTTYTDNCRIFDNEVYACGADGIYIGEGANLTTCRDNASHDNADNGVLVYTSVSETTKPGTNIADVIVKENHIYNNGKDGVRVQIANAATSISNTSISRNKIFNNNQDASTFSGISLSVSSGTHENTQIEGNTIHDETTAVKIGANVSGTVIGRDNRYYDNTTIISDAGTATEYGIRLESAANIADVAAAINTTDKYPGKRVWDTTNKREMRAAGATAASDWEVIDGSAQVTPA